MLIFSTSPARTSFPICGGRVFRFRYLPHSCSLSSMASLPRPIMVAWKNIPHEGPMPSSAPIRPDPTHARYEALLEVAESIAAHRQLSTLFADLSRCLNTLVSFDFISLTLLDSKGHFVRMHLLQTDREVVGTPPQDSIPVEQTPTGAAIRTR